MWGTVVVEAGWRGPSLGPWEVPTGARGRQTRSIIEPLKGVCVCVSSCRYGQPMPRPQQCLEMVAEGEAALLSSGPWMLCEGPHSCTKWGRSISRFLNDIYRCQQLRWSCVQALDVVTGDGGQGM